MIRLGIVGTGGTTSIAESHLRGILQDGRASVTAVFNRNRGTALAWIQQHHLDAVATEDYKTLLSLVDGVIICTPNAFHCQYVEEAMAFGKHFLVEKPLGISLAECQKMASVAANYPYTKMIGFTNRFVGLVDNAKSITEKSLGRIFSITAFYGGKRLANPQVGMEWRMQKELSGSGALGDFGSHLIDLVAYLTGIRFESIFCMTDTMIPMREGERVENDDTASFVCKGQGSVASFLVSRVGMDDLHVFLTGEGGMLELSLRGKGFVHYWEKNPLGEYTGKEEVISGDTESPYMGAYEKEISTFLDAMEGKPSAYPDIASGLYVQRVLDAAEKSMKEKREISI